MHLTPFAKEKINWTEFLTYMAIIFPQLGPKFALDGSANGCTIQLRQ